MDWRAAENELEHQARLGEAAILAATAIGVHAMKLMADAESPEARRAIQEIAMKGVGKLAARRESGR